MKLFAPLACAFAIAAAGFVFGQSRPHPPTPSPQAPPAVAPAAVPAAPAVDLGPLTRKVDVLTATVANQGTLLAHQGTLIVGLAGKVQALEAGPRPDPVPPPVVVPPQPEPPPPPVVTADVYPELVAAYEDIFRAERGAWHVIGSASESFHALNDQLAARRLKLRAAAFDPSYAYLKPYLDPRTGLPTDPAAYRDVADRVQRSLDEGMRKALGL